MTETDTPPSPQNMNGQIDGEDMIYVGDVDEVIEAFETEEIRDEDLVEQEPLDRGDASCVFAGHRQGQESSV